MVGKSHGVKLAEKVVHDGDCGDGDGCGVKEVGVGQRLGGEEGGHGGCSLATACNAHGR